MPVISIPQAFNEDGSTWTFGPFTSASAILDLIRSRLSGTATYGRRPRRG